MTFQKLMPLAELKDGEGKELVIDGVVIAVFRRGDQVYAVDGMCAHQGGPLAQGHLDANCITCPWHGWQYDIMSGENVLTGKKMLAPYPVEIRDSSVWIDV